MPRVTFLGGPRDGEIVDWCGHQLLMPAGRLAGYVADPVTHSLPHSEIRVLRFEAQQDLDGRWFYVLRP